MLLQEGGEVGQHQRTGYPGGHIDPQAAANAAGILVKHGVQLIEIAQQIFCPLVVNHALFGELYPAGSAVQQAHAKRCLQRLDLPRYAGLRLPQRLRRQRKALHVCDMKKQFHCVNFIHRQPHLL